MSAAGGQCVWLHAAVGAVGVHGIDCGSNDRDRSGVVIVTAVVAIVVSRTAVRVGGVPDARKGVGG